MSRTAKLTGAPELRLVAGALRWHVDAVDAQTGGSLRLRLMVRAGEWFPYQSGDIVDVAYPYGTLTAGRITGLRAAATVPTSQANTEFHARGSGSLRFIAADGRVDLGEGTPADQAQLAMHADLAAGQQSLQAQLDALVPLVEKITATVPGAGAAAAVEAVKEALGTADGGKAASNVYAKPEELPL